MVAAACDSETAGTREVPLEGFVRASSLPGGAAEAVRPDRRLPRTAAERAVYLLFFVGMILAGPCPAAWLVARGAVTGLNLALFGAFYALTTIGWALGWHRMLAHRAFELRPWAKALLLA